MNTHRMELLAPAGDLEKLETVYTYGADAAYIGLSGFSLRRRADDVEPATVANELRAIKGTRRLYGALNIYFHNSDLRRLEQTVDSIAKLPLDALIVSDIGVVPIIRRYLPDLELHLSTQANCLNTEAARIYQDLGFSRIIPAREMSLDALAELKATLPDLEVETFVHGAMCLAYSGRCLLSAWQAGRSGNKGACAHSCRWKYRYAIEEAQRPGEYLPVEEGDGFTTILSPKDLCMIDHLQALADAGIDAVKIEGRVKSAYYAAIVTRAYRKEIDRIARDEPRESVQSYIDELYNVSHREFSTGFYFGDPNELVSTQKSYQQAYRFVGRLGREHAPGRFELDVKNAFSIDDEIEYIGPDLPRSVDRSFTLLDRDGNHVHRLSHQAGGMIEPGVAVQPGFLIRQRSSQRAEHGDAS
ncbi:MAG: peptidase U32 family protein [Spirochaetota bacterium]